MEWLHLTAQWHYLVVRTLHLLTDVCNHFSSLHNYYREHPIECNVDKIPANRTVVESSVSNLAGKAVTTPTNMDSDSPVNGAAIKLSLAQFLPTCVGNLTFSRPACSGI